MHRTRWIAFLLVIVLAFGMVGLASGAGTASVGWRVFGGGGAYASGGEVGLHSTLGQTAVGFSSGGDVGLEAGYWAGAPRQYWVYLPLALK